jgi:MFS family permease
MADSVPIRHRHGLRPAEDEMAKKHVGSDDDDNKGDAPKRNQVTSLFGSHGGGNSSSKINHSSAGSISISNSSSNINGSATSSKSSNSSSAKDSQGKHRRSPLTIIWASPALVFVFLAVILMNAGLAVTVPSLALQLDSMAASPELLGYIAAAAPLVSVFSPTITGLAADKFGGESSYTCAFAVTLTAFALGNLAQAFARGPLTLCLARVLVGCSTGATTIAISHIIRELQDKDERVRVVAVFSGSEMLGYIAGTAIGGMLSTVRGKLLGIRVNGYNAPTLVSAAAALLLLLLGLPGFRRREAQIHQDRQSNRQQSRDEIDVASRNDGDAESGGSGAVASHSAAGVGNAVRRGSQSSTSGGGSRGGNSSNESSDHQNSGGGGEDSSVVPSSIETPRRASRALFTMGLLVALYCMVAAMYNALETVATPLTLSHFGWGVRENALMWTLSGVVGTVASLGVGHLPPGLAAPSDLLAVSLAAAAVGPWLMRAGLKQAAAAGQASGIASAQALSAAATAAHAAAFSGAPTHHSGRHRGAAAAAAHAGFLGGGSLQHPLFWVGFLLFDMGYVVSESMITVLYASAVEVAHGGGGGGEDGNSVEIDENEGEGAFAFGIFNSVGWFLGCALGAVAGNELYLKSASHMLIGCSCTALAVGASLTACRRAVFSPSEAGWLLRRIEPSKWVTSLDASSHVRTSSSSGHKDLGISSAGDEAVATHKSKKSGTNQSPATFQRRGNTGRGDDPSALDI